MDKNNYILDLIKCIFFLLGAAVDEIHVQSWRKLSKFDNFKTTLG
jgi:hypothetical protein